MNQGNNFDQERRQITDTARLASLAYLLILVVVGLHFYFGEEGARSFLNMKPNEVGDLLAGIAGPIAFIWLVYGYFLQGLAIRQQGVELSQNTEALNLQAESLRAQVEELKNSVAQQKDLAETSKSQMQFMKEAMRPNFVLAFSSMKDGCLDIWNAGAVATNVKVTHSEMSSDERWSFIDLFEGGGKRSIEFFNPLLVVTASRLPENKIIWMQFEYHYGSGFSGKDRYQFIYDAQNSVIETSILWRE